MVNVAVGIGGCDNTGRDLELEEEVDGGGFRIVLTNIAAGADPSRFLLLFFFFLLLELDPFELEVQIVTLFIGDSAAGVDMDGACFAVCIRIKSAGDGPPPSKAVDLRCPAMIDCSSLDSPRCWP